MAASSTWVITANNETTCRWETAGWSRPASRCVDNVSLSLPCGHQGVSDGPTVVHSELYRRFFYAAMTTGGSVCLLSAPDTDPLNFDRARDLPFGIWGIPPGNADQPHIGISHNKVGITLDNFVAANTVTLVISMADILANAGLHTNLVQHGSIIRPMISIDGADGPLYVTRVGINQPNDIVIGQITGVPGQNGGTNYASGSLNLGATTTGVAGVVSLGRLYTVTALTRAPFNVEIDEISAGGGASAVSLMEDAAGLGDTVALTEAPATALALGIDRSALISAPAVIDTELRDVRHGQTLLSISATPSQRVIVGFSSGGLPWLVTWGQYVNAGPVTGPVFSGVQREQDFVPVGAAFPDLVHPGQWFGGVGWISNLEQWAGYGGRHGMFLRDDMIP
jgi:hypothetical protein